MASADALNTEAKQAGAFAPFRHRVFAVLWAATVFSNIGMWMRDTASAWLMTDLSASPIMVALIQSAAMLPVFLLSLPAGALADIYDRRKLMIAVQAALALLSITLGVLTFTGIMTANILLALTLIAGVGNALNGPVWQSIVPELVPKADLKSAVALNSLGINISRAIGPAVAGVLIAAGGVAAAYFVDVLTYVAILAALIWWPRSQIPAALPERFGGAMRTGIRYAAQSTALHRVLLRAMLFFIPASCVWALLPLVSRQEIGGGASGYGILLGAVGGGAILGALIMPALRKRLSVEGLAAGATGVMAFAMGALAFAGDVATGAAILTFVGVAWITSLTTLNATAQSVLPNWVRGRGLAIYLTVFFGAMTAGSVLWGWVAQTTSLNTALLAAGAAALILGTVARVLPLPQGDDDLTPSHHWPEVVLGDHVNPDRGPVMVTVEYRIAKADQPEFLKAIPTLSRIRRRDGAYDWGVMADADDPERATEWFLVGSWSEHLRQHDRVSIADKAVQDGVQAYHRGSEPPVVRHLLSLKPHQDAVQP